ncbi:MAG TPA: isoprenylcysteine carboxylmethyltransferase family protein [Anaeromyxobacteraceae bacterium]|jgi:methyltransferase|nr:isoprenylcysteine carboxylmethyltransferase family protein [Anaeromyxobacteraceae bacterium]
MVNNALPGIALLGAVTLERGAELWLSARNARRLRAAGAVEAGRGHYPVMVAFHAALLAACLAWPFAGGERPRLAVALPAIAAALLAQGLRWWAIAALGPRWTTRILVPPGAPPVTAGPYRFFHHPNYLAVAVEVAALPLAVGAWIVAVAATLVNAALMGVRIPAEERALGAAWAEAFGGRAEEGQGGGDRPAPGRP